MSVTHKKNRTGRPQNFHQKLFVCSSISRHGCCRVPFAVRLWHKTFGTINFRGCAGARSYQFGEDLLLLFQVYDFLNGGEEVFAKFGRLSCEAKRSAKIKTQAAARAAQALG